MIRLTILAKSRFAIDTGAEKLEIEGYKPMSAVIKFLMKKRRSLLSTKDKDKVEKMFLALPNKVRIEGKRLVKSYDVKWERVGTGEFEGARFTFTLEET